MRKYKTLMRNEKMLPSDFLSVAIEFQKKTEKYPQSTEEKFKNSECRNLCEVKLTEG